ncbi:MAG: hypothetical protein JNK64_04310 [Myxococcales bacterium]|nr:hypothetical protein [Myxococcales bacterium]
MFAFAIMAAPVDDLRAWVSDKLAPYGYALGDGGEVIERGREFNGLRYRVDGPDVHAARPWHVARSRCPFVGPLAGYVTIEPVWETLVEHRELRLGLLREGRGVIARLDDDRALAAVALRRFDVRWQLGKYGFEDGDCLLTRDGDMPYAADVGDRVDAAIRAAGFDVETTWTPTCHNPLRVRDEQLVHDGPLLPLVWRDGVRVEVAALHGVEVEIWAYDFDVLDDEADDFWR